MSSSSRRTRREPRPGRRRRWGSIAVIVLAIVLAGVLGGSAWWLERQDAADDADGAEDLAGYPDTGASPVQPTESAAAGVPVVDPAWLSDMAARTGIPEVAMRAYAVAELRIQAERPTCELSWTMLAGIGWVESQHGTLDGAQLQTDGTSQPTIIGPALDGSGGFAAIRADPDFIAYHGDTQWDHAVGPMQFIGSTWAQWGADGDGDGRSDPRDLDDAAYAAAEYLCHDGYDLTTGEGWAGAVFTYNHEQAYVESVYAAAADYAARSGG